MKIEHIAGMLSLAIGKTQIHKDFLKNFFVRLLKNHKCQNKDFSNYSSRTQRKYTNSLKKSGWIEYNQEGKSIYYRFSPLFYEMLASILENFKEES